MTPPRVVPVGGGVVARSSGPGGAAIALIILAAVLAGTTVFMLVKKSRQSEVAATQDAGFDTGTLVADLPDGGQDAPFVEEIDAADPPPAHDAWEPPPPDAAVAMVVDAAVAVVVDAALAPRPDAAVAVVVDAGAGSGSAALPPAVQAKLLMQQAHEANQEGDFEKALALANSSIKLRPTARAYLVRAQALQRLTRIEDALDSVDSAEQLAPDFASVFEMRGSILWAAGRFDAAKRVYARFLELEPDSARAVQVRKRIGEQP